MGKTADLPTTLLRSSGRDERGGRRFRGMPLLKRSRSSSTWVDRRCMTHSVEMTKGGVVVDRRRGRQNAGPSTTHRSGLDDRRASPIVFGPRTLVRTWGTRAELWDTRRWWRGWSLLRLLLIDCFFF